MMHNHKLQKGGWGGGEGGVGLWFGTSNGDKQTKQITFLNKKILNESAHAKTLEKSDAKKL
jgi:hypothetical protein